jgi:hypothetical protein
MILKKNERAHKIEKHIDSLLMAAIIVAGMDFPMVILKNSEIEELISKESNKKGEPIYCSVAGDKLIVHPLPGSYYNCRLIGSMIFEQ